MFIWAMLNKIALFFPRCIVVVMSTVLLYSVNAHAVEFQVIGNVHKGTCEFIMPSQEVILSQPVMISDVTATAHEKTNTKAFTIKYNCSEFDFTEGSAPYQMQISAGSGTVVTVDNKISPVVNKTNAAFILSYCHKSVAGCELVDVYAKKSLPFDVSFNGQSENNFEVSVVKLNSDSLNPGELIAAVDVLLIQP